MQSWQKSNKRRGLTIPLLESDYNDYEERNYLWRK
jgi:hypothetical protein